MPDSQTIYLFAAAALAAIVCFRLFTVLGRRTGQEPQARPAAAPLTPAPAPAKAMAEPGTSPADCWTSSSPTAISTRPNSFQVRAMAYIQIVTAFASGRPRGLAPPAVAGCLCRL